MSEEEPRPTNAQAASKDDDTLLIFGGSNSDAWNNILMDQVHQSLWIGDSPKEKYEAQIDAFLVALAGIQPKTELEGMIAAQLLAAHNVTMECYRRAMLPGQTFEGTREALNQANKLTRNFAMLVATLDKHRGKGQQKVTVEHVHVYAGGQAVVGLVEQPGGGGQKKLEEQPHAQQITYAPEPSLWGDDAGDDALPVPSDGEWSLPNAWGQVTGCTEEEF